MFSNINLRKAYWAVVAPQTATQARAAEQERLARQAIKRQSENKSGKLIREESEFAADGEVDVAGLAPGDGGLLQLIVFAGERCRPRYRTPNISQDGWTGLGCRGLGSSSAKTSTVVPPVANSLIWARWRRISASVRRIRDCSPPSSATT